MYGIYVLDKHMKLLESCCPTGPGKCLGTFIFYFCVIFKTPKNRNILSSATFKLKIYFLK